MPKIVQNSQMFCAKDIQTNNTAEINHQEANRRTENRDTKIEVIQNDFNRLIGSEQIQLQKQMKHVCIDCFHGQKNFQFISVT